ncbi:MAG: glycosyltransferase family 2 protein [Bacteroidales bacterium]|nr:glycosyltransferase family 2 protein [Bacteroidales bacterium]
MKVSGFTFIKNAIKFDYPIKEAILSVLPLVDEFIVAVGDSEDSTRELIESICPEKIKIIDTIWDDSLREGGRVLAVETDKALKAISADSDWCFYIQGDEVLHEKYIPVVKEAMKKYKNSPEIEGLLFKYLHFYGSYDYVGESYRWYRYEIRVIKNNPDIFSYRDAQGFRKKPNKTLRVKQIDAYIYHYGWVKEPKAMQLKQENFNKLWHSDEWVEQNVVKADEFDYSNIDALRTFEGTHPKCMEERINNKNWKFDYDISFNKLKFKDRLKRFFDKTLNTRFAQYSNYKLIK